MKFIKPFIILISALSIIGCKSKPKDPIKAIEEAHHKTDFLNHKAVKFDILLKFRGKERLNATITLLTNSSKGLIEYKDGSKIYTIGDKVFYSPNFKNVKAVRFDAYTWSYFFMFPYKLSDQGTQWSEFGEHKLNQTVYNTQKLSFTAGTGDAPDDWYYVYSDQNNHLINTAAYIVTFGKTVNKAESDPHAIKYDHYKEVEGIPIATNWTYWEWNKTSGISNQLGEATISNISFVNKVSFEVPQNFIEKE
ncbi:hypothetical protein AXE80_09925 [Wenyingzhuangia fucanilytica]|uniref:Heat-shock protein Hsp90 n=1 Tax=Wenyingzhuangia fucanilytica TaxID=1790137 RepID=A0A1B1Y732_9FLAO|nr:hypothetical protein [Wenyingzhuangia fucanilytica]ANW96576.1 hypothetical protein AXE80_09925 [Wenyingzhuangia fucanilytica]